MRSAMVDKVSQQPANLYCIVVPDIILQLIPCPCKFDTQEQVEIALRVASRGLYAGLKACTGLPPLMVPPAMSVPRPLQPGPEAEAEPKLQAMAGLPPGPVGDS